MVKSLKNLGIRVRYSLSKAKFTEGEILHNATLKVQTIAKFGRDKGNSTSEEAEFIFIIVQKVIKCLKIQVVSCVLNPVQNAQILEMTKFIIVMSVT